MSDELRRWKDDDERESYRQFLEALQAGGQIINYLVDDEMACVRITPLAPVQFKIETLRIGSSVEIKMTK